MENTCTITVYFEDPFWVGLYERTDGKSYQVCKLTFGGEPRDYQVYGYLLENWRHLPFSPTIPGVERLEKTLNHKRQQRLLRRQQGRAPVGTKAQEALKLQYTEGKEGKRARTREHREEEAARSYALRQEKKREKHKGH